MAESPAHKFGQIIGETLEAAIEPLLRKVAQEHGLYLDRKGRRPARKGKKVSWKDQHGNVHDLDYVLERGGTPRKIGVPVAFIESAWRRYTKHSRNKAQEIQGAVLPLRETHYRAAPFVGVVLAGEFTQGSLEQLRSFGFSILYFPYEAIIQAFTSVGIDATSTENTPDAEFARKVKQWGALSKRRQVAVAQSLLKQEIDEVTKFVDGLTRAITRQVGAIRVLPLHGTPVECTSIEEAINFIVGYDEAANSHPVVRYEVAVKYNNGDSIVAQFSEKEDGVEFLRQFQGPELTPAT
ncbi:MAG: DNA methylase [Thermodesulfobacteriota bacterium]